MKKILIPIVLLAFVLNSYGSPLIFKTEKQIVSYETFVEVAVVDVSKYKKIRVGIVRKSAKKEGIEGYRIYAVEGEELVEIGGDVLDENISEIVEVPSNTIKISIRGSGRFAVYVWGLQ